MAIFSRWLPILALVMGLFAACSQPTTSLTSTPSFLAAFTSTPTPIPTPTPTPTLTATAVPTPPAVALQKPAYCVPADKDGLQDITDTLARPYMVRHPASDSLSVPTIVFLSGGSGSRKSAQRTFKILDEVLACYGGNALKVHLAGVSNGGLAAFALMLRHPERFATLLGAPGAFPVNTDPADWAKALAGHAVFNGVGANDDGWKSDVKATDEALVAAGIDSVYVEFAG